MPAIHSLALLLLVFSLISSTVRDSKRLLHLGDWIYHHLCFLRTLASMLLVVLSMDLLLVSVLLKFLSMSSNWRLPVNEACVVGYQQWAITWGSWFCFMFPMDVLSGDLLHFVYHRLQMSFSWSELIIRLEDLADDDRSFCCPNLHVDLLVKIDRKFCSSLLWYMGKGDIHHLYEFERRNADVSWFLSTCCLLPVTMAFSFPVDLSVTSCHSPSCFLSCLRSLCHNHWLEQVLHISSLWPVSLATPMSFPLQSNVKRLYDHLYLDLHWLMGSTLMEIWMYTDSGPMDANDLSAPPGGIDSVSESW